MIITLLITLVIDNSISLNKSFDNKSLHIVPQDSFITYRGQVWQYEKDKLQHRNETNVERNGLSYRNEYQSGHFALNIGGRGYNDGAMTIEKQPCPQFD